jgi:hypothetical protein
MKTYRIFYRVPANETTIGYKSETLITAASGEGAMAQFIKWFPRYSITAIFDAV